MNRLKLIRMNIQNARKRRKLLKLVPTMSYDFAMRCMRSLAYGGVDDPEIMLACAERAVTAARDDDERYCAENWARPLRAGRRIKIATGTITSVDGVPTSLIDQVNQVFEDEGEPS